MPTLIGSGQYTVTDLSDGLTSVLSATSATVATNPDGSGGSYAGVTTTMSVLFNDVDDSTNWTYTTTASSGVTYSGTNTRTVTVTAMSVDTGYIDLTATKFGVSLTKRFSVSKSKQGVAGTSSPAVNVTSSRATIFKSTNGTLDSGQSNLVLTADAQGITSPTYAWTIVGTENAVTPSTTSTQTITAAQFGNATSALVTVTVSGTYVDTVTITRLDSVSSSTLDSISKYGKGVNMMPLEYSTFLNKSLPPFALTAVSAAIETVSAGVDIDTLEDPFSLKLTSSSIAATSSGPTDPYFDNVVLLLHGEGADGSSAIVDSSKYGRAVFSSNSVMRNTTAKFGATSIYNGASSSYFKVALGTDGLMTGDFTVEMWVRDGGNNVVFMAEGAGYLYNGSFQSYGGSNLSITTNFSSGIWHHLAISRIGSTIMGFTDGVLTSTQTYAGTVDLQTLRFGMYVPGSNLYWNGYFDEVRITKDVGRYNATFAVPTAAFPDGATGETSDANLASVVLHLSSHGLVDIGPLARPLYPTTLVQPCSTAARTGTSSLVFPIPSGSDVPAITLPYSADFDYGSGDFTWEVSFRRAGGVLSNSAYIISQGNVGSSAQLSLSISSANKIQFVVWISGSNQIALLSTTTLVDATWYDVMVSKSGSTYRLFINGVIEATGTYATALPSAAANLLTIGIPDNSMAGGISPWQYNFRGYLSNLRITKGVARRTANYTPVMPLYATNRNPTVTNVDPFFEYVTHLLHGEAAASSTYGFNSAPNTNVAKMRCTTGGSAVISSAQSKFGSTSFSFDGSSTGQFYMGTGSSPSLTSVTDWTMEAWVRPASTGFVGEILSQRNGSDLGFWLFRVNSDRTVRVYAKKADSTVVTDVATTATLTANVWTHVAAVRNAGVVSIYINGSRATLATTANSTGVWPSPVGAWSLGNEDGGSGAFNGFIDEVRVTVGVARYTTASFTVQTAPYPDIGTANGKHRYWRIQGMLVGASGFQLSELQFTKDGNDVATPAYTASATPGVGALADLFDGSLSTRCSWTSAQVTAAFWIQADYGAGGARVIDSLRMGGYTASTTFPTSLTLQYSDDGVAWTTKDSTTTAAWPGNGVISASIGFPGTDTAPHRFWRVTAISGITSFLEISELQFCAGGISQVPALNWSHTPSAGSTSLTTPRDGNLTTYSEWTESVTEASGLWISLDMRQPVAVDGLKLGSNTAATYPTQVGLMFSDDNVTWNITHDYATLQPIIANNLSPNIPFITVNYSAPSNVDPYFANVKLLLQGLGSSVIDRSSVGRTITTSGSVGLSSTGNLKYNPYSFGCTGSDPIYSWAVTSDFNFGSQDFTIEFWCNLNTTGTWQALFSKNAGPGAPSGMVRLLLDPASSGSIFFSVSGVDYNIGTGGLLTAGVWRHVAVAKQGTVLRFFVNGVLVGTSTGVVATIPDYNPSVVRIGCQQDANTFDVSGSFDDYRVTVGVARYLAAFTPPAQTLPNNSPSTSTIASSILSNLVAYWEFEQNDATTTFLDSHSNNHLSVMTAGTPNSTSSVTTTTGAKVGRAFNHNGNTDRTAYIPRSNTRLDIANRDLTFGGWMQANTTSGSARWVMGRTGSSGSQYVMTLTIDSTTDRLDLIATTDGSTITRLTSAILPATGLHFVAATLDRINNVLRLRVTGAGGTCNVTTPFTGALYTAANTANFCIGDGLSGDSTFFSGNREPVNGLFDQCFFVNKALTDAEYAYLYNTGSGRSYASIVSDATPVLTSIPVEAIFAATNATFNIKLTQNRYWIVSAYVKSDVASATGRIGVETSTGADFVSGTFTTSSTSGTWSRVWCVLDLSASSQTLAHFVLANDLFSANNMWVSHVMVEECMSAPPAALTFPNINPATVLPSPYQYPGEGRLVADRLRTGTLLPGQTITIGTPTTADGGFEISAGATTGLDSIAYKVSGTERIRLGYLSSGVIGMRVKDSLGNTTLESVDPLALKTGAALYTTNIATITAALDLTATDVTTGLVKAKLYHIIVVNSASSVTITLPDASSYLGITYKIINKNSGNVVISRSGSTDTIYGTYANTVVSAATSLDVAVAAARYFELTAVEADTWMISG